MKSLKTIRLDRGQTQAEFADAVEVSEETIRRLEAGARPTPRIGKQIADHLGCKYTDLWPIEEGVSVR